AAGTNYSGGTFLNANGNPGIQFITANATLGTGPVTITGETLLPGVAGTPIVLNNPISLNGYISFSNNTANAGIVFAGPVTLAGNTFLNTANGTRPGVVTFSSVISGSGALTVANTGTTSFVVLNNVNTYTGGTYLVGGTVLLNVNNAVPVEITIARCSLA